jgi:hypothetical protein
MWSHWFEIMASLGLYRAAGMLAAITGAALSVFLVAKHWERLKRCGALVFFFHQPLPSLDL